MILYIAIILVLLGLLYIRCSKKIETFSGSNMIQNGDFNNGKDVQGVTSKESNFSITNMVNPSDSSYVLKQTSFNGKGYNINIAVALNTFYYISFWTTNDNTYDGDHNTIDIFGNEQKLSNLGKVIEERRIDDFRWKKIVYIVNSSNYNNLTLKLGKNSQFSKGFRVYCDIVFRKYLPELPDFEYQSDLEMLCIASNSNYNKSLKSKTGKHNLSFQNKIQFVNNGISIKDNIAKTSHADILLGPIFSIIFSYHGKNNDNGSIFKAIALNDLNSGVNIELQYGLGVDNYLVLTIGGMKYIYQLGIVTKMTTFAITYNSKSPRIFIDNIEIPAKSSIHLVKKRSLGTCPDGWKYLGNNKCQPLNQNKGSIQEKKIVDFSNVNPVKWANKNEVNWANCKKLSSNEIAPVGKETCEVNVDLNFTNKPIEINSSKTLTGSIHNIIIYKRDLDIEEIQGIHKYLLKKIHIESNDLANIVKRPSLIERRSTVSVVKDTAPKKCAFNNPAICKSDVCGHIDWSSEAVNKISLKCKNAVNKHCSNNTKDKLCNKLRMKKVMKIRRDMLHKKSNTLKNKNIKQGFTYYSV